VKTKRRTKRSRGPTQADSARWGHATTDDKATPAELAYAKELLVQKRGVKNTRRNTARMLVPERGLRNTRRNRRWLAIVHVLDRQLNEGQEKCEALAWEIINTWEVTS